jgi:hypothetical protein
MFGFHGNTYIILGILLFGSDAMYSEQFSKVLEEHTTSIFRVQVQNVRNLLHSYIASEH